ncbi:hypothetical protein scyTo_0004065 [Scyliorhinus torazame]|uniref:Uncharacterized protein n=1 Tax=Scyliorhinus torazame TaxID=75743 RepID=A0A401NK20_SCYTO|nr:hypothetical protein [Scyliorhinus torazame]
MAAGLESALPVQWSIDQLVDFRMLQFKEQRLETSEDLARVTDPARAAVERMEQKPEAQGVRRKKMEASVPDQEDRLALLEAELTLVADCHMTLRGKVDELENRVGLQNFRILGCQRGLRVCMPQNTLH